MLKRPLINGILLKACLQIGGEQILSIILRSIVYYMTLFSEICCCINTIRKIIIRKSLLGVIMCSKKNI